MDIKMDWLRICRKIGDEVSKIALELYGTDEAKELVKIKKDADTTVKIDKIAENKVVEILKREVKDFFLISEELGKRQFGKGGHYIAVDPIDGSENAKRGLPLFTLSIAVLEKDNLGSVIFGYVKDLIHNNEYYAEKGKGAFRDNKKIAPRLTKPYLVSIYFYPDREYMYKKVKRVVTHDDVKTRYLGCISLETCYVAAGITQAMVDTRKRTRPLDIAAAKLIAEEAGAVITDDKGNSVDNTKIHDSLSSFIASCDKNTQKVILGLLD